MMKNLFDMLPKAQNDSEIANQADYIGHLYNAVPEGIALISVDKPYRFIQQNRQGVQLLKYPEGDVNDTVLGEPIENMIHPDDYDSLVRLLKLQTQMAGKAHLSSAFKGREENISGFPVFWKEHLMKMENRFLSPPFTMLQMKSWRSRKQRGKYCRNASRW